MSVYNEANVSDQSVHGGPTAFNYLDGESRSSEEKKTVPHDVIRSSATGTDDKSDSKDAGDAPTHHGEVMASAPTVTEMYRGPERGFQSPRDYRSSDRRVHPRGQERGYENHENKRAIQSQPELGSQACHQYGLERTFLPVCPDVVAVSGLEEATSEGRGTTRVSASDVNTSVSLEGRSEVGTSVTHDSSGPNRSNVVLVTSNPPFHKLSRRSERRLKKYQSRENDEEEELASLLSEIYRRNSHTDAHQTMVALKSSQSTSEVVHWIQDHHDRMGRGAEYHKVSPPKKNRGIDVHANMNNNALPSNNNGERITCNQVMETLRRQPMKLAAKERYRSAVLSLASTSKSAKVGNFDRRRHLGFRRRVLNDRRHREPRGSGGFFVSLIKEFGQPITSYFDFLRWLILANLLLSLVVAVFLVVPQYLSIDGGESKIVTKATSLESLEARNTSSGANHGDWFGGEGNDIRSIVAALFSGSKFMTRYPTPIYFSFYGEESRARVVRYDEKTDDDEDGSSRREGGENEEDTKEENGGTKEGDESSKRVSSDESKDERVGDETVADRRRRSASGIRVWGLSFYYDFSLAYALTLHVCTHLFIVFVLLKMVPFTMESIAAKLERVDRGFALLIFATFDHGATDETTKIINQISMTDELLTKLDAADASANRGPRRQVRSCCDVSIRIVVALLLLALVLLLAWALEMLLLEKPFALLDLLKDYEFATESLRRATAFFDDFAAPAVLFFGVKLIKWFSTIIAGVENWKPAKKGKMDQGRMLAISVCLTLFYLYCVWKSSCSERPNCWPVLIGQHFYRIWLLDFLWSVSVVVLVQFPRKILFSQLCLHRPCGRFAIQRFSISRRILDLIFAQTICLLGLYYAPGLVFLTAFKFICIFYLMRLTVHCNCIPKGRLFQSMDATVFSYILLCASAVVSVLPFQLALMQGLPIKECGPFTGTKSFSELFHLASVGHIPESLLARVTTFLDSPLAPVLVFIFVIFGVVIVFVVVTFAVQRQKIYQLQYENHAGRRDRAFLLQQYDANATAASSSTSVKNAV